MLRLIDEITPIADEAEAAQAEDIAFHAAAIRQMNLLPCRFDTAHGIELLLQTREQTCDFIGLGNMNRVRQGLDQGALSKPIPRQPLPGVKRFQAGAAFPYLLEQRLMGLEQQTELRVRFSQGGIRWRGHLSQLRNGMSGLLRHGFGPSPRGQENQSEQAQDPRSRTPDTHG